MKSKKNKSKAPSIAVHLILTMLLAYPLLFSFSHSLSHHRSAHHHQHCEHSKEIHTTVQTISNELFTQVTETCPICDYEFAPLLEPNSLPDQGKAISHFLIIPSLTIPLYCEVRLNQFPARAPPAYPIHLLG